MATGRSEPPEDWDFHRDANMREYGWSTWNPLEYLQVDGEGVERFDISYEFWSLEGSPYEVPHCVAFGGINEMIHPPRKKIAVYVRPVFGGYAKGSNYEELSREVREYWLKEFGKSQAMLDPFN